METEFFIAGATLGASLLVYCLPTLVAAGRRHSDLISVLALNLLLGWTLIGWATSLVWALNHQSPRRGYKSTGALAKCPFCSELIQREALTCRYCKSEIFLARLVDGAKRAPQK